MPAKFDGAGLSRTTCSQARRPRILLVSNPCACTWPIVHYQAARDRSNRMGLVKSLDDEGGAGLFCALLPPPGASSECVGHGTSAITTSPYVQYTTDRESRRQYLSCIRHSPAVQQMSTAHASLMGTDKSLPLFSQLVLSRATSMNYTNDCIV